MKMKMKMKMKKKKTVTTALCSHDSKLVERQLDLLTGPLLQCGQIQSALLRLVRLAQTNENRIRVLLVGLATRRKEMKLLRLRDEVYGEIRLRVACITTKMTRTAEVIRLETKLLEFPVVVG